MASATVPTKAQILVIGAGPAGSYSAAALANEGFEVVLLEAAKFPRYHIGESLLASVRHFLGFIGAFDTVDAHGFTIKPGAAFKFNQYKREAYTAFTAVDPKNYSWNVVRSEFDDLLFKHAAKCGATVFDETKITEIQFDGERPVSASWVSRGGVEGQIAFDYLVDASGRNGIMSTKYLRNRHFNKSLNNIACWGYWEGTGYYSPADTTRENAVWIEALPDETGWAWFIPLHDGSTSVGIVLDQDISNSKKKRAQSVPGVSNLQAHYEEEVKKVPGLMKLIGDKATLKLSGQPGSVKSTSDFSYSASSYAGDHYRIVGDAGAFVDPFYSSGVHLAFNAALSAAITISASIRGSATETEAQRWHTSTVGTAYTRFLLVVLSAYKQMRNQDAPILSDVDEDNFDRVFDLLRPVIQGTADVGKKLTEHELKKTMDFCTSMFAPTDAPMIKAVSERVDPKLLDPKAPIMTHDQIDKLIDRTDEEARLVLGRINVRKQNRSIYDPFGSFTDDNHFGFRAVLERGNLRLVAAA
ncbi:FAD/NAD-binding domain-containing protein [Boletus coccyginus]|nr:FAD/NAD-binding domain-containing protein [Boletus coccyginus]